MRYFFIFLFSVFSSVCYGQINIINQSLTESSINIFYIGIENVIKLKGVKNESYYNIVIKGGGSQIRKENKSYIVSVNSVVDSCILSVYNQKGKNVFERWYKTRIIPNPVATLAGLKDTTININRLLVNPFIYVVFPGCYLRHQFKIISFAAIFITDSDSIKTLSIGSTLSEEQVKLTKQLNHADKIYFDGLYATCPDCRSRKLPSFWIKIE
jgi:GldM C-terminal domain